MSARIVTGVDALINDTTALRELAGKRIGVLCHSASVTHTYQHVVDALIDRGLDVCRLFAPEHGVRGVEQAMDEVDERTDSVTGLPVTSLYGTTEQSLVPDARMFDGLDCLLIDVQDVGVRYYTYAATAWKFAEVATSAGIACWVLDRPNPLGRSIEGPIVDPGLESFVGTLPVPTVHGLTMAEMIGFARALGHPIEARVFRCQNWDGKRVMDEQSMTWVMPSPNMPTLQTAQVYAGMCLLEATNVSEARGTTRPFELFGAPWVDAPALKRHLELLSLPGVRFRETAFKPTFEKFAGQVCKGLQLHVVDVSAYQSLLTGVAVIHGLITLHGDDFAWRAEPYEFVSDRPAIDLLIGNPQIREALERGEEFSDLAEALRTPEDTLRVIRDVRNET